MNLLRTKCLLVLLFGFFLYSCDKEEIIEPDKKSVKDTFLDKEKTEEELIAEGYVPLEETVLLDYEAIKNKLDNEGARTEERKWSYSKVTWDDLKAIDSRYTDQHFMRYTFKDALNKGGRWPDGVSINDVHLGWGHNPSTKYGWWCYKYFTRKPIGSTEWKNSGWKRVYGVNSITIPNWTSNEILHENTTDYVSISNAKQRNWSIEASASVTVGGKVGIPLVSEGSVEVTVSLGGSRGGEITQTITVNPPTGWFKIPPHTDAVLTLAQTTSTATTKYDLPVRVEGWVGGNYGKRVDGHYFWAVNAGRMFKDIHEGRKKYRVTMVERQPSRLKWFVKFIPHDDDLADATDAIRNL
ncbi:hypothetical protein GCM10009122_49620 [Fulvivirga kasyanovii]|uniref:hypothetical protein n=2 Tax=Fulvivirga kasyanovii TaxID=396812 RepID=UPI0031D7327B